MCANEMHRVSFALISNGKLRWLAIFGAAAALLLCQSNSALSGNDPRVAASVGDFNRDGSMDAFDLLSYIRSFGIGIQTYGLTDDLYNPGYGLPRRPYDWKVKVIAADKLPGFSVAVAAFPPQLLPNLQDVVDAFVKIPARYIRMLGQQGYAFLFRGEMGRLANEWGIDANGWKGVLRIWHAAGSPEYAGRIKIDYRPDGQAVDKPPWEPVTVELFDGANVVFVRNKTQRYAGTLTEGQTMSGAFTYQGAQYSWSATRTGGCHCGTQQYHEDCRKDFTVGCPGRWIALELDINAWLVAHEIGHAVQEFIDHSIGPFGEVEKKALNSAGFADGEEFANMFAGYFVDPVENANWVLQQTEPRFRSEIAFLRTHIDVPDAGPTGSGTEETLTEIFALGDNGVLYCWARPPRKSGQWSELSMKGDKKTRVAPIPANCSYPFLITSSDTQGGALGYISTRVPSTIATWKRLPGEQYSRLPVATILRSQSGEPALEIFSVPSTGDWMGYPQKIVQTTVRDGAASGDLELVGTTTLGFATRCAPATSYCGQDQFLFAVGAVGTGDGKVFYSQLDSNGNPGTWQMVPGDLLTRTGVATAVCMDGRIEVVAVGTDFRLYHQLMLRSTTTGNWVFGSEWQEVPGGGITASTPKLTNDLTLYMKRMSNGLIFMKALLSPAWSSM